MGVSVCYGSLPEVRLSVSVTGPKKGLAVSSTTISRIKQIVFQAYASKGWLSPFPVIAYSTKAIGTSWAFRHQVCKAATWSSVHTFTKFYKVDVSASLDACFGRKVLQAAV